MLDLRVFKVTRTSEERELFQLLFIIVAEEEINLERQNQIRSQKVQSTRDCLHKFFCISITGVSTRENIVKVFKVSPFFRFYRNTIYFCRINFTLEILFFQFVKVMFHTSNSHLKFVCRIHSKQMTPDSRHTCPT